MKFKVIHTDPRGETRFSDQEFPVKEIAVGPPPNPVGQMRDFGAVTSMFIISFTAGTEAPAHNAPQPYICIVLSGTGEVITSDGESKLFHAGDLLICNDTTGKGHITRAISDLTLAFVNRACP